MQKVNPFLWFDGRAEEAAHFYTSIFSNNTNKHGESKIVKIMPGPNGTAMGVTYQLDGQTYMAINGGPQFKFTEAISLFVNCESQEEIDYFWNTLGDGGSYQECGWLKDKFGLSWQIIPTILGEFLDNPDREKANKAMQAMLQMQKIDIEGLQKSVE